jgi:acetyl-CoA carboxylase beta subunit
MVWLKCKKCGKEWDYTGKMSVYATCPNCRSLVRIDANEENKNIEQKGGEE